jgi:preprotein translocase subunit SecE
VKQGVKATIVVAAIALVFVALIYGVGEGLLWIVNIIDPPANND